MPPKKKHEEHTTPPAAPVSEPAPPVTTEPVADAGTALYRDKSGPAREAQATEGGNYRSTMEKLAREAAGLPPLEDS